VRSIFRLLAPWHVLTRVVRARVQAKSEGVKFRDGEELPETIDFLDFIYEVCLLFDSLGKAGFSFVKSDLETKSAIIRQIYDKNPEGNQTLQQVQPHHAIPAFSFSLFGHYLFNY
jgi:hypothetical protein